MKPRIVLAVIALLCLLSQPFSHAQDFAPLPATFCLTDLFGSLRFDVASRAYTVTLNGVTVEGTATRFDWFPEQAYVIFEDKGNSRIDLYSNIGIRRNVGFAEVRIFNADGSIQTQARIGNPGLLDCEGDGPTGPPFTVQATATKVKGAAPLTVTLMGLSSEDQSRSNWIWTVTPDGEFDSEMIGFEPCIEYTFDTPGRYFIQVTAIYEVEVAFDELLIVVADGEPPDNMPPDDEPLPPANQPPVVEISASKVEGKKKLKTILSAVAADVDGRVEKIEWLLDGEKAGEGESLSLKLKSKTPREYAVICRVTDDGGATTSTTLTLRLKGKQKNVFLVPTINNALRCR